jgi:PAS domain S-box-containing protein
MTDKLISISNTYSGKPISETIVNGFFTVNRQWIVKYWNKAAEQLLNVQEKDIIGKNLWEKFPEAVQLNFYTVYHQAFLQDIPIHFEEYWAETGKWFDVITYHSKDILSVSFKTFTQSSQKKNPQNQLRDLNELYRFVTEVTNDCLWEWDFQSRKIFWIDGGHKRVFGYDIVNSLIPQSFWESCLHPDDKSRILARLNKIKNDGSTSEWEDEYRFQKADGEYAYVHDRGHVIYKQGKACRMVGATEDVTARKLTEFKLAEERLTKQREITGAVLTAQENERAEIGKELHDNVNQILVAAMLYMKMAKGDNGDKKSYIDKSCSYIVNAVEEIRKISKMLIPIGMQHISLVESIHYLLEDISKGHPIKIEFNNNGIREEELNEKLKLNIFRIVQEQFNNILKHSKATRVSIGLSKQESKITLIISDNGAGCDMLTSKKGVGIINIKSRADLYHGKVTIISKPAKGFELKVELFLNNDI